jgi:hypothetical protein
MLDTKKSLAAEMAPVFSVLSSIILAWYHTADSVSTNPDERTPLWLTIGVSFDTTWFTLIVQPRIASTRHGSLSDFASCEDW